MCVYRTVRQVAERPMRLLCQAMVLRGIPRSSAMDLSVFPMDLAVRIASRSRATDMSGRALSGRETASEREMVPIGHSAQVEARTLWTVEA